MSVFVLVKLVKLVNSLELVKLVNSIERAAATSSASVSVFVLVKLVKLVNSLEITRSGGWRSRTRSFSTQFTCFTSTKVQILTDTRAAAAGGVGQEAAASQAASARERQACCRSTCRHVQGPGRGLVTQRFSQR